MRIKIKEKKLFKELINKNFGIKLNKVNSFCTDSREIKQNDIFLSIKGKNIDSHQFIPDILQKKPSIIFSEIDFNNKNIIKVKSTKETLKNISIQWMKNFKNPIIGITGSNGKTTTKEMLNKIFSYKYNTNCTTGNFNSSIGLPINLFNFSLDAKITILEMGANNPNEIKYLCDIAPPDYSLITNIQSAHIGNFKSLKELQKTKFQIFDNTHDNGIIFENVDDYNIYNYFNGKQKKIRFGFENRDVDFLGSIKKTKDNYDFFINGKKILNIRLNQIMAKNMLASYSIAHTYGISHNTILKAFKNFNFLDGRGKQIYKNGYLVVDDTYNANFESFKNGIKNFMSISSKGRKILVIGDMKELGKKNDIYHYELGQYINSQRPEFVFSLGESIQITNSQIKNNYTSLKYFSDFQSLIKELKNIITKNDAIYLKASRSMKFENIVKNI